VCICDENVDDLQCYLNNSYDLVAITCLTSNAPRAYEIVDIFKITAEFFLESELDVVQYSIATPLPGTRLFWRLSKEGIISLYLK
jgi:hypothetical protein